MFKNPKVDQSILLDMKANLIRNAKAEQIKFEQKKLSIINKLAEAAEESEQSGKSEEAESITKLMEHLAKDISPEQMVKNLKQYGWVFDKPKDEAKAEDSMCVEEATQEELNKLWD